nr:platelet basic protein-like [Microcebus murinus]
MGLRPSARASCARARPARVLQLLLLLSLLLTTVVPTYVREGKHSDNVLCVGLQCRCERTLSWIHPSFIRHVEIANPGEHCSNVEVIATLKSGRKVCLNPDSPVIKKTVYEMMDGDDEDE